MRLIDADELRESVVKEMFKAELNSPIYCTLECVIADIEGAATAYDMDKVVATVEGETAQDGVRALFNKLAEYEDLEEQGLLLKLPCKVGDTVYEICDGFIEPCTVEVIFIADYMDKEGNHSYIAEIHYDRKDCPYVSNEIYFTDFGKTVFLTQAEAALKKGRANGK